MGVATQASMDRTALHLEIRNALSIADELSRHEHALGDDDLAGKLAALRSALDDLERDVGRSHASSAAPDPDVVGAVERSLEALLVRRDGVPSRLARRFRRLLASAERVSLALWQPDAHVPSRPLLGVLPLARAIPQDVHSVMDYAASAACLASALLARTGGARAAGVGLAMAATSVALTTDDRLGAVKRIPIETHETIDYAWGASVALAPFVLGYAKKDPVATILQVAAGVGTILASLFTDYRAWKGLAWPIRSKGGPGISLETEGPRSGRGGRVPDAQRPLEGFSSAPTDWQPDHPAPTTLIR
jgi:hypothetical protein